MKSYMQHISIYHPTTLHNMNMIFYFKIFLTPHLQYLPLEWYTTYIVPFEICKTYIVFPEVFITAIVVKYLVPIRSYR